MAASLLASSVGRPRSTRLFVALGLVYLIWSSTYFALRIVVTELPPFLSGGARYLIAGAVLLGIQRARGAAMPTARQWLWVIPIGALLFAVGNGLVASAERTIASGIAAVVCGTTPLWAGVAGPAFGAPATRREWLGMALGFAGVVALSLGDDLRGDPLAAAFLLLAPIGWAVGSLWSRKLPLAEGASGAAAQMITGGAVMLALAPMAGEAIPTSVGWGPILALGYLIVFGSLVAFSAYHYVLANARPALAMSNSYVNPVLALVLGAMLGAEHIGPEVLLATALIAGAVVLLVRGRASS
jgi:drug/metabolite transporter (DMT)-like permease